MLKHALVISFVLLFVLTKSADAENIDTDLAGRQHWSFLPFGVHRYGCTSDGRSCRDNGCNASGGFCTAEQHLIRGTTCRCQHH